MDYILHGVNYQTLLLMLSDAPRYVRRKRSSETSNTTAEVEAGEIAGFFQSKLKE